MCSLIFVHLKDDHIREVIPTFIPQTAETQVLIEAEGGTLFSNINLFVHCPVFSHEEKEASSQSVEIQLSSFTAVLLSPSIEHGILKSSINIGEEIKKVHVGKRATHYQESRNTFFFFF